MRWHFLDYIYLEMRLAQFHYSSVSQMYVHLFVSRSLFFSLCIRVATKV